MPADVLVVEPNRTVRRIVERTLRGEGWIVRTAADGHEALALVERMIPSILLLEQSAAPAAQLGHPTLRTVPIVTMGVRAPLEPLGATKPHDPMGRATATLAKPFAPDALVATLASTLALGADRRAISTGDEDGPPTRERLLLGEVGLGREDSLAGRLEHVPLADVLQLLSSQGQTGTLEIKNGETAIAIGLLRGRIDLVIGRGLADAGFRLGRHLLAQGLVTREALSSVLATQDDRRGDRARPSEISRLGALLVARGQLTSEQLRAALTAQTTELLVEALRLERGTFRFVRGLTRAEAAEAHLELAVAPLLLDAVRRVDEWRLLEARVRSLECVLEPEPSAPRWLGDDLIGPEDRALFGAADGERTLRALVAALGTTDAAVVSSALRLLAMKALRLAGQP